MSFKTEKQNAIKRYILEKIAEKQSGIAKKTADAFDMSQNSAYRYIRALEAAGGIRKTKNGEYELISDSFGFTLQKEEFGHEDRVFEKYIIGHINEFPSNVRNIWAYGFSEMLNNCFDHSRADTVVCRIVTNPVYMTISINDNGIGIFRNIMDSFGFATLREAMQELFKGKLTTDKKRHSGEGIFFTSRMMDSFAVLSDGMIFTHNKYEEVIADLNEFPGLRNWMDLPGTTVIMRLSNSSMRQPSEVFRMFENEEQDFCKTSIPVKNFFEDYPVSRSQAKRLYRSLEKFKEVTLDFEGVNDIGQGFAHELFRVFGADHPDIKLEVINANENVEKMIKHVRSDHE